MLRGRKNAALFEWAAFVKAEKGRIGVTSYSLDLFVECWLQCRIVSGFFLMRFFDYVHPYVHVFLKRSAITLVDDHGWPDIYSRLKKLDPTSITAYRVRSLFLLVADEFIGVILSGEGIVSGIPFSMQICIVSNGGVMEASHISIMPTSVKYFLFRGCKNLTRRRSHKQWVVGDFDPPS